MRRLAMGLIGGLALASFAAPAMAHDGYQEGRHYRQHERLADEHDDVHEQLDEEHEEAHEQGLSPWEHRQLHRELRWEHREADYAIARQHQREHQRDAWRRYGGRRYYGYYGY